VLAERDDRGGYRGVLGQDRFDFAEFDAEAVHLHLMVDPAEAAEGDAGTTRTEFALVGGAQIVAEYERGDLAKYGQGTLAAVITQGPEMYVCAA
jgi:hypothetical protein